MSRKIEYVVFTFLLLIAYLFYAPTFASPLFFNQIATDYSAGIFLEKMGWARWVLHVFNYFTFSTAGLSVEVFRVQNFVVHALAAGLFFVLFSMLFELIPADEWLFRFRKKIVITATGLFLLHPVQTQTVLNVEQMRLEGVMTLAILFALYCFLRVLIDSRNQVVWYKNYWMVFALGGAFCSVFTKEASIVLPVLALILDWFFVAGGSFTGIRSRAWAHVVFAAIFFLSFFVVNTHVPVFEMLGGASQVFSAPGCLLLSSYDQALSAFFYARTQIPVLMHYLWIFFYPFDLYFDYDVVIPTSMTHPLVLVSLSVLVFLLVVVIGLWIYNRRNIVSFGIVWFFVALLPRVAFCAPSAELVGDYKTFLASVGMMILLAGCVWFVIDLVSTKILYIESWLGWGFIALAGLWGVFILLGTTKTHTELSLDPVAFWKREVEHTPSRARNFYHLANALRERQSTEEALAAYQKALVLDDEYADPLIALGKIYQDQGDLHRALSFYVKAEKKKYSPALASHLFLSEGIVYLALQEEGLSEEAFKKALQSKPVSLEAYFQYAQLLKKKMCFKDAYVYVDKYLRSAWQKDVHEAILLKARLAFELGQHREVITLLENGAKPEDISLTFILAASYYLVEDYKRSAELFEKVYEKCPDNLDVAYNYAQALMRDDKFAQAVAYFKQCAESLKYPFASVHIATCLMKNGNTTSGKNLVAQLQQQELLAPVKLQLAQVQKDFYLA